MNKLQILVVEDDKSVRNLMSTTLKAHDYKYIVAKNGEEAILQASTYNPDIALLDLGLPGIDGLSILRAWRDAGLDTPVLILTARGDVDERIKGLNSGADDYLGKPFALKEVQARLNALIRRRCGVAKPLIRFRDITFNPETKGVLLNGEKVILSPRETALLELLLLNKNKVLSKETIENKLYSWDEDVASNAVEVHIHHLRKKLGKDIVKTINKIGYTLED